MDWRSLIVAIGGAVMLSLLSACGGRSPASPAASPMVEGAEAATATTNGEPSPDDGFPQIPTTSLRAGDPVPLPDNVALYATDAAYEGPSAAFRRYYRDPSGAVRTDDLFLSRYTDSQETSRAVVGATSAPGGSLLALALCHGFCYGLPLPTTIIRSEDGGITWEEVGTLDAGSPASPVAVTTEGVLIRGMTPGDFASTGTLPSALPQWTMSQPPGLDPRELELVSAYFHGKPVIVAPGADARLLWNLDGSGTVFARIPLPPGAVQPWRLRLVGHSTGLELHVAWPDDARGGYLGLLNVAEGKFRAVYSFGAADGLQDLSVTEWLSDTVAIGRASFLVSKYSADAPEGWFGSVPAIIDFQAGTVSPIAEFVRFLGAKAGGAWPEAVARGPFARVVVGDGDCLNVRKDPGATADAIDCVADGVLLTFGDRQTESTEGGNSWLHVTTPGGLSGWASTSYLEY